MVVRKLEKSPGSVGESKHLYISIVGWSKNFDWLKNHNSKANKANSQRYYRLDSLER